MVILELFSLLVFHNDLPVKSIYGWWFYNYGEALYCTPNIYSEVSSGIPVKSIYGWWFYNYGEALYCTPNIYSEVSPGLLDDDVLDKKK